MKLLRVTSSSTNLKCLQWRILETYSQEFGRDASGLGFEFSSQFQFEYLRVLC